MFVLQATAIWVVGCKQGVPVPCVCTSRMNNNCSLSLNLLLGIPLGVATAYHCLCINQRRGLLQFMPQFVAQLFLVSRLHPLQEPASAVAITVEPLLPLLRSKPCSAVLSLRVRLICAAKLHQCLISLHSVSPALNGSTAQQCFKRINVVEMRN